MEIGISGTNPIETLPHLVTHSDFFIKLYTSISKLKGYDGVSNKLMIDDLYEEMIGNRTAEQLPIALNMKGNKTNNIEGIFEQMYFKLLKYNVPTLSNTSLPELLKMPKFKLYSLYRSCRAITIHKATEEDEAARKAGIGK